MATDSIIVKALVEEKAQGEIFFCFLSANAVIADHHFIVTIMHSD